MAHDHHHHHHHIPKDASRGRIKFAFFLNLAFTLIELAGGIWTNSVAILSDAIHDLGDSLALGLAWLLQGYSEKDIDSKFSYGYRRFSLLAALINTLIILIGVIFVLSETIPRLFHPQTPNAEGMLWIALVGIAVNGFAALRVSKGHTLNERAVAWHLFEDVLGWVAVLIASIVMLFKDIPILDPLLAIGISLFVGWNIFKSLREALTIFLQAVPKDLKVSDIRTEILSHPKIKDVHHIQVWSLDGHNHVLTSHVILNSDIASHELVGIKQWLRERLKKFHIEQTTIEFEYPEEHCSYN